MVDDGQTGMVRPVKDDFFEPSLNSFFNFIGRVYPEERRALVYIRLLVNRTGVILF